MLKIREVKQRLCLDCAKDDSVGDSCNHDGRGTAKYAKLLPGCCADSEAAGFPRVISHNERGEFEPVWGVVQFETGDTAAIWGWLPQVQMKYCPFCSAALPDIIPNPNTPQPQMDDSWQMHSSCCGWPRNRGQCSCWPTLTSVTLAK